MEQDSPGALLDGGQNLPHTDSTSVSEFAGALQPSGSGSPGGHSTLAGELAWSEPGAAPREGRRVSPTALWSLLQCASPAITGP